MHQDHLAIKTEDSFVRSYTIMPPSATELQKVIKSLEKIVMQQKQKRENAQRSLEEYRVRSIKRQQQMNSLIYKLKKNNSALRDQNPEIAKLFNTIWSNFDLFNQKSIEMLEQKCEDTIGLMDRKIKSIVSAYEDELEHSRKKSNVNVQSIMDDIRKVYIVAAKIQQKSIQVAEQNRRLQFEIKVLKQQKILAIEDAVNRKRKITCLQQENKKLVDQLLQARLNYNSQKKTTLTQKGSNQSITGKQLLPTTHLHSKKFETIKLDGEKTLLKQKSELYSLESLMDNHNARIQTLQYFKDNNQAMVNSTISYTPRPYKYQMSSNQALKMKNSTTRNGRTIKGRSASTSQSMRQKSTKPNGTQSPQPCTCPLVRQNNQKQYYYMNTIQNIQKSLKRQKQKSHNLGTIVTQISSKSKEINEVLQKILQEEQEGLHRLEILTKSQKLFQILKILKQRLSMIQKPSLNCGWGDSLEEI